MALALRKFTPYNVFIKWPFILLRKFFRSFIQIIKRAWIFRDAHLVVVGQFGIRNVLKSKPTFMQLKSIFNFEDDKYISHIKSMSGDGKVIVYFCGDNPNIAVFMDRLVGHTGHIYVLSPKSTYWDFRLTAALNRSTNMSIFECDLLDFKELVLHLDNFCKERNVSKLDLLILGQERRSKDLLQFVHDYFKQIYSKDL